MSIGFSISGILEAQAKVNGISPEETGRRLVTKAAIWGENLGKQRSPVDFGRLRNSITHRVDSPFQARYGTNVFYGIFLDQPRTRTPHYRGGPFSGSETAGWLSDTAQMVEQHVENVIIPAEIRAIEASW